MKLETETVKLPSHWASALINGDASGFTPGEEKELSLWLRDNPQYGTCLDCSSESELTQFDGLLTECHEYTFPVSYYTSRDYEITDGNGKQHKGTINTLVYPIAAFKTALLPWQERGLSFTASGYGKRIPTSKMILLAGVWRRVYCTIYGNAGTCWINFRGVKVNVDSAL